MNSIPFNKPFIIGKELEYIKNAVDSGHLSGDGAFTHKCSNWLETTLKSRKILLTHSCTAALEMSALLCGILPGDEFILPSFTFVSTANAFVLRGGIPIFVDIRPDTLNIDEKLIEQAITAKTKAIVVMHYAGVACDMDTIMEIASRHQLIVIEDAAQAVGARYKNRYLGTIGDLGCYSFHETKNFISGEGGALSVNNKNLLKRAEIIREKGTNRSSFFRGEVEKYTWVDLGSSYLPSELIAAFLYAQLEESDTITAKRISIWNRYYNELSPLAADGKIKLPYIPDYSSHNGHMFYIVLENETVRTNLIRHLNNNGISSVFHYIPLHQSPMGSKFTNRQITLPITEEYSRCLLRLPFYYGLEYNTQLFVIKSIRDFFR